MSTVTTKSINVEVYPYKGTHNLRRLERVLGISIVDKMNETIANHVATVNQSKLITEEIGDSFYLYTRHPKKHKKLALKIENGLLLDNYGHRIRGFKAYCKFAAFATRFTLSAFKSNEFFSEDTNNLISNLATEDFIKVEEYKKLHNKEPSKYFLSKLKILTTTSRYWSCSVDLNYHRDTGKKITELIDMLIAYDLSKSIIKRNKAIRYSIVSKVKELIMPKYIETLQKHKLLYSTAAKMQMSPNKLVSTIPKECQERYFNVLQKYPVAHSIVERFDEFIKFDTQNLVMNDAHPKLIKQLIVDFYQSISPIRLANNIITKVLRVSMINITKKSQGHASDSVYVCCINILTVDVFLLVVLSGLPQMAFLSNKKIDVTNLRSHCNAFKKLLDLMRFLGFKRTESLTLTICRNSFNSSKIDYSKLINKIDLLDSELRRIGEYVCDDMDILKTIRVKIISRNIINIKLLDGLHNLIADTIRAISQESSRSGYSREFLEHSNAKLAEIIDFKNYKFEQISTSDELNAEGDYMHHCVDSYYASNTKYDSFIFAVYPNDISKFTKSDYRSTLAIRVTLNPKNKIKCKLSQNFSYCNSEPHEDNYAACKEFVNNFSEQYYGELINFINKSNRLKTEQQQQSEETTTEIQNRYRDNAINCINLL